jgi:hypothetical protein
MKYQISGIVDCRFLFNHVPVMIFGEGPYGARSEAKYHSKILLKIHMAKLSDRKVLTPVKETLITFSNETQDKIIEFESPDKVSLNMPLNSFDGLYKMLSAAVHENKYKATLETTGKTDFATADFYFKELQ